LDFLPPAVADRLLRTFEKVLPGAAAQERMAGRVLPHPDTLPDDVREAAVLILLQETDAGDLQVLLIERTSDGSAHSGQIAFPGGRRDPEDTTLLDTALREAWEEVGLDRNAVHILGALTPLYIPVSRFQVYPFVGVAARQAELTPSPAEVVRLLFVPLDTLFHPQNRIIAELNPSSAPHTTLRVPAYRLPGETVQVWGATAMILSELQTLLSDG
jgi:8-oxo-dGTP pyrophosphatase MutT (NUDIX family)